MGTGSYLFCCGKGKKEKGEFIIDDHDKKEEKEDDKNDNNNTNDNNNIIISNINFDNNYTFRGKSSQLTNSVLVLSKNDDKINKGPFVPNTIEQKNTKEEMGSFDELYDKLN